MSSNLIYLFGGNAGLLAKLKSSQARYVIVGGVAVRFYLPEREVDDLDLLIEPSPANTQLIIDAVNTGGSCHYPIEPTMLAKPNIQWPVKSHYYVDILTPREGIEFEDVWANSIEAEVAFQSAPVQVRVARVSTLLTMLSWSAEPKHKRDIESLSKIGDLHGQKA